jgi:hypothetical protein
MEVTDGRNEGDVDDDEPDRCPDCGCDLETEYHDDDCSYDNEEDDDFLGDGLNA